MCTFCSDKVCPPSNPLYLMHLQIWMQIPPTASDEWKCLMQCMGDWLLGHCIDMTSLGKSLCKEWWITKSSSSASQTHRNMYNRKSNLMIAQSLTPQISSLTWTLMSFICSQTYVTRQELQGNQVRRCHDNVCMHFANNWLASMEKKSWPRLHRWQ